MIPVAYKFTRWVIAVLTLLLVVAFILLRPTGGASVLFVLSLLVSLGALLNPPGVYFWLIRAVCPDCGGRVQWAVEQGRTNPYIEEIVARCPGCGKKKVEYHFNPT